MWNPNPLHWMSVHISSTQLCHVTSLLLLSIVALTYLHLYFIKCGHLCVRVVQQRPFARRLHCSWAAGLQMTRPGQKLLCLLLVVLPLQRLLRLLLCLLVSCCLLLRRPWLWRLLKGPVEVAASDRERMR